MRQNEIFHWILCSPSPKLIYKGPGKAEAFLLIRGVGLVGTVWKQLVLGELRMKLLPSGDDASRCWEKSIDEATWELHTEPLGHSRPRCIVLSGLPNMKEIHRKWWFTPKLSRSCLSFSFFLQIKSPTLKDGSLLFWIFFYQPLSAEPCLSLLFFKKKGRKKKTVMSLFSL